MTHPVCCAHRPKVYSSNLSLATSWHISSVTGSHWPEYSLNSHSIWPQ
jgi:hypothetical protein